MKSLSAPCWHGLCTHVTPPAMIRGAIRGADVVGKGGICQSRRFTEGHPNFRQVNLSLSTVRQSITALYEESRKFADDGAPMLAVIESGPVREDSSASSATASAPLSAASPIAARFDELRRLAEIEAGVPAGSDEWQDPPTAGPAITGPAITGPAITSPADVGSTETSAKTALPEEPPAPAPMAPPDEAADLDISDIRELVRQAWADETGITGALLPEHDVETPETASVPTDIETAMQDIAAAVVQSANTAPADIERIKQDIITAMREEMKSLLEAGLARAVKAAVAEALAEMPATIGAADSKAAPESGPESAPEPGARKTAAKPAGKKVGKKTDMKKTLRKDPSPDPDDA